MDVASVLGFRSEFVTNAYAKWRYDCLSAVGPDFVREASHRRECGYSMATDRGYLLRLSAQHISHTGSFWRRNGPFFSLCGNPAVIFCEHYDDSHTAESTERTFILTG